MISTSQKAHIMMAAIFAADFFYEFRAEQVVAWWNLIGIFLAITFLFGAGEEER